MLQDQALALSLGLDLALRRLLAASVPAAALQEAAAGRGEPQPQHAATRPEEAAAKQAGLEGAGQAAAVADRSGHSGAKGPGPGVEVNSSLVLQTLGRGW